MAVTPVLQGNVTTETPKVGEEIVLDLTENVPKPEMKLAYGVSDDQGNEWVQVRISSDGATFSTVPSRPGDLKITANVLRQWDQKSADPLVLTTSVAGSTTSGLIPGQVPGKVLVGMSTDSYDTRVRETGPIGSDHFFIGSWSPDQFMSKVREAKSRGLYAYGNIKTGDWGAAGTGALDRSATELAEQVAAFGWPAHICFHHEPGFKSPNGTGEGGTGFEWRDMHIRLAPRMRDAGNGVLAVGCVDNGFKFSPNTRGQGWTDDELNQLYTDEFLDAIDSLGADYYDGATSKTNGEPAYLKVQRADAWMDTKGWNGGMDIGEYNFVRPSDSTSLFAICRNKPNRWWCILNFNSDNNNRTGIPTVGGGWNLTHDFEKTDDRLNAFKGTLADPMAATDFALTG